MEGQTWPIYWIRTEVLISSKSLSVQLVNFIFNVTGQLTHFIRTLDHSNIVNYTRNDRFEKGESVQLNLHLTHKKIKDIICTWIRVFFTKMASCNRRKKHLRVNSTGVLNELFIETPLRLSWNGMISFVDLSVECRQKIK